MTKFAAVVVDTGGKFAPVSLMPVVHLDLQISQRILVVVDTGSNFAAGLIDTSGKFATGVVDTGGAP